ncbi:MAG TPA: hypothetical protein VH596_02100 [Terriglobales bacterium]|jgi:hypothetical protein
MQICEQIFDLLIGKNVAEAIHLVPPESNDICCAIIIRREATGRKILMLKKSFQAWALAFTRRIRGMAAVAVLVVDVPARSLLCVQAKLGVASTALYLAAATNSKQRDAKSP